MPNALVFESRYVFREAESRKGVAVLMKFDCTIHEIQALNFAQHPAVAECLQRITCVVIEDDIRCNQVRLSACIFLSKSLFVHPPLQYLYFVASF